MTEEVESEQILSQTGMPGRHTSVVVANEFRKNVLIRFVRSGHRPWAHVSGPLPTDSHTVPRPADNATKQPVDHPEGEQDAFLKMRQIVKDDVGYGDGPAQNA